MNQYAPVAIYTDGGCVRTNPSPYGGTWAWRQVDARGLVPQDASGLYIACGVPGCIKADHWSLPTVSNNAMEFVAVVLALEYLPPGWHGQICSDSQITLGRLFGGYRMSGIPTEWVRRCSAAIQPLDWMRCTAQLIKGHPTKADLAAGVHIVTGRPVSIHNVACDAACTAQTVQAYKRYGTGTRWGCPPLGGNRER